MIQFLLAITIMIFPIYGYGGAAMKPTIPIRVVGSSSVFPFITIMAEEFGENSNNRTPIVESTGTGGGFKIFCSDMSEDRPQLVTASRPMHDSELMECRRNGVVDVREIKIGYDGVIIASSINALYEETTTAILYEALNKEKAKGRKTWREVNKSMPNNLIEVYGPSHTSGTREVFEKLVMQQPCLKSKDFAEIEQYERRMELCSKIRDDGRYIQVGENDNLIVQKLKANPGALGIFGYNFLQQNSTTVKGLAINGFKPTYQNILSGKYPLSRPLYLYYTATSVKKNRLVGDFLLEITSNAAIGMDGYLVPKGLIPLSDQELREAQSLVKKELNNK